MPGMKDFVSVKIGDTRMHVQKRLILCNLREVYASFKTKHGNAQIGFSKFADLRPKECVLAGASGTHSVRPLASNALQRYGNAILRNCNAIFDFQITLF